MVNTRSQDNPSPDRESREIPGLREIVAAELGEVLHEILPGMFDQMKQELTQVVNSRVEAAMADRGNGVGSS